MPIYAYRCQSCGFAKDVLQKVSDPVLVDCPECHQPKFAKQLTAAGFHLKGTGWYVTDFKNGQQKPPAAASSSAAGSDPAPATAPVPAPSSTSAPASASDSSSAGSGPASGSSEKAA
jgi:putative FmdB family regulatory protein